MNTAVQLRRTGAEVRSGLLYGTPMETVLGTLGPVALFSLATREFTEHPAERVRGRHQIRYGPEPRGSWSPIASVIIVERAFSSSEHWTSMTGSQRACPACVLVSVCSWRCGQPDALDLFGAYWPISSGLATTRAVCRMGSTCGSASLSRGVCRRTRSSCRCSPRRLDRIHRVRPGGSHAPGPSRPHDPDRPRIAFPRSPPGSVVRDRLIPGSIEDAGRFSRS
jgi:hypothetical protein